MSRKPIQIELKGLKTPRERVWETLLKLAPQDEIPFTKNDVYFACQPAVTWSIIDGYLLDLTNAGWLARINGGPDTQIEYRIVKRQAEAPRITRAGQKVTQGSGTEAMWRAMKVLPVFDYIDVAKAATLGDLVVKPGTAKTYVQHLAKAGYLSPVRASKPGVPAKHRLVKNTGMHAPAITRTKVVFDRNTGEVAPVQTAQEVCDGLE